MRFRYVAVLAMLSALPLAAQDSSNVPLGLKLDGLKIPVELTKTIKAEKAQPGDPIELRMAEPILLGHGLILPRNAKLLGHVLGASGAADGKRSHLSIVVDKAEWKGHELPLHAVVDGLGARRRTEVFDRSSCAAQPPPGYLTERSGYMASAQTISVFECSDEQRSTDEISRIRDSASLSGVSLLFGNAGGYSVLVSKKNIHLNSGMLVMLKNSDVPVSSTVEGSK